MIFVFIISIKKMLFLFVWRKTEKSKFESKIVQWCEKKKKKKIEILF